MTGERTPEISGSGDIESERVVVVCPNPECSERVVVEKPKDGLVVYCKQGHECYVVVGSSGLELKQTPGNLVGLV